MEPETTPSTSTGGNNKTLWIVGIVIIIAAVAYFLMRGEGASTTLTTLEPGNGAGGEQSIAELLAAGTSQTCTFAQADGEGTVYVAGGKMRGDFTSLADGKTVISHMISDGTTAYTWVDGMPTGFKMMMNAQQAAGQQSGTVDVNQKLAYTCSPWTANTSAFTTPVGMQFNDLAALTSGLPTGVQ